MIDLATLSVIRRWALREQLPIREIARRTGLSRSTIKKCLRGETIEPRYAKRVSPSNLDPNAAKLSAWLKTESSKSRRAAPKAQVDARRPRGAGLRGLVQPRSRIRADLGGAPP